MKKSVSFWGSLEKYGWGVIRRSPLPHYWRWMGIGGALLIIVISWSYSGQTVVGARNIDEVVEKAARLGDYAMAQKLWEEQKNKNIEYRELEDAVYPERKVERRIAELEAKLVEYPGNRQIYLGMSDLYDQLGNGDKSDEYREKARILDPNN